MIKLFIKFFDSDADVEADTELEDNIVMDFDNFTIMGQKQITTEMIELQLYYEVLRNVAVYSTENTEITTTESVAR